jgi:hypothetical protein
MQQELRRSKSVDSSPPDRPKLDRLTTEFNGQAVRRTADGRASVFDLLQVAGAKNPRETFKRIVGEYPDVVTICDNVKFLRSDGKLNRETPAVNVAGWRRILTVLPGIMGNTFRETANQLVDLFVAADIRIAESIVERNNNPVDLDRLDARLKGKKNRQLFTETIAAHGGSGQVYSKVSDATNLSVTGFRARDLKVLRKVTKTRDSFTTEELTRTSYIEMLSAHRMDNDNVQGDGEIVASHGEVVTMEGVLYRHLTTKRTG